MLNSKLTTRVINFYFNLDVQVALTDTPTYTIGENPATSSVRSGENTRFIHYNDLFYFWKD